MKSIENFIKQLSEVDDTGKSFTNIYSEKHLRENLKIYLEYMFNNRTENFKILVGEAPGYRGCAKTGVPFTDEKILIWLNENVDDLNFSVSKLPTSETSAQIIWQILKQKNIDNAFRFKNKLMWNIFPFHPYKVGNKNSNRKPNPYELNIGEYFLNELINIFSLKQNQIYAIGNTAAKTIKKINNQSLKFVNRIRHPSYGGKKDCQMALLNL